MATKAKLIIEGDDQTARAFNSAVGNAKRSADLIRGAFEGAFAGISIAVVADLAKKSFEVGEEFKNAALKAGIGGKSFSELAYAAKLANVDVGGLSTGIKKMQVALSQAATGAKEPNEALEALGLKLKDIRNLAADEQFTLIGDRISKLKDPADRTRAAVELFGRAGEELLPLFEKGAAGIEKARREAEQLGVAFSDEQLNKLADAEESIKHLTAAWQGFYMMLAAKVAPTLTTVLNSLAGTREGELQQQIKFLETVKGEGFVSANPLGQFGSYKDIGTGIFSAEEGAAKLAKLKAELESLQHSDARPGGRGGQSKEPGFIDHTGDAAAAKAAADRKKEVDDVWHDLNRLQEETKAGADRVMDEAVANQLKLSDMRDEWYKEYKKREDDLANYRYEKAKESAQVVADAFLNAWDGWVNNGKFKVGELVKYVIAQFARAKIAKWLDTAVTSYGKGSQAGGIIGGIKAIFGYADGGRPPTDRPSIVGERGPELWWPDRAGSIVPNHAMAGRSVSINYNVDARGATTDLVRALPGILRAHGESVKQDVFSDLRRRRVSL